MISIYVIISLLLMHYIADFVCQTNWMAQNKSKTNYPLLIHVLTYATVFLLPSMVLFKYSFVLTLGFVLLNTILHFITDYFTSRISSNLYMKGNLGSDTIPNFGFFSIIGLDQLIHYITLFVTFTYFQSFI